MTRQIKSEYDAVIVGAGIGGLLSASFLAKKGYTTCVLETLSFYGGKFTAFDYKGFQVPSGAFHLIPGGPQGGLGKCFTELGLNLEYRSPDSALMVLEGGKRHPINNKIHKMLAPGSYLWRFSWKERLSFMAVVYYLFRQDITLPDISFGDFLKLFSSSARVKKFVNQFMIFANGTNVDLASLIEFKESVRAANYNKGELVVGGCRHLTDELVACVKRHQGELFNKTPVSEILVKGNRAMGVKLADGRTIKAGLVVTNVGARRTARLLGRATPKPFKKKQQALLPAIALSYSVATDTPLLDHDAIELPIDYDHLCGYVQISALDSSLAPPGKHYLLAAQMVVGPDADEKEAVVAGIDGGISDLLSIFPQISRDNIINISAFHRDWPGVETGQFMGQSGTDRYPIKVASLDDLYMVGHDSQGWGFAGDIIGHAAWKFNQMI